MSLPRFQNRILKDCWPGALAQRPNELPVDPSVPGTVIDVDFETLAEDIDCRRVKYPREGLRTHEFVHQATGEPVLLRLFGVLKACKMTAYGTFKGHENSIRRSRQYVELEGCGADEAFLPQLELLYNLRKLAGIILANENASYDPPRMMQYLFLCHRTHYLKPAPPDDLPNVTSSDDPHGWFAKTSKTWYQKVARVFKFNRDGVKVPMKHAAFLVAGDFVEVVVRPLILYTKGEGSWQATVSFDIVEVVKLSNANQLLATAPSTQPPNNPNPDDVVPFPYGDNSAEIDALQFAAMDL